MEITVERAIEILTPKKTSYNEEEYAAACKMARDALNYPLKAFTQKEAEFRLKNIFHVSESDITSELINDVASWLYDDSNIMFDYDAIDNLIEGVLDKNSIDYEL